MSTGIRDAARLVYKGLQTSLVPATDLEYRELLASYRAEPAFRSMVEDVAAGLDLMVLDVTERGLIAVPASRESKFAVRLSDIRVSLTQPQKAALLLAHIAVAAVFFPTTDRLEDDSRAALPAPVSRMRDTLLGLAKRLQDSLPESNGLSEELEPGWSLVASLPVVLPSGQRASPNSVVGLVKLVLTNLREHGLVRLDRDSSDDTQITYTATHRLRVQLRELSFRKLLQVAQSEVPA